MPHTPSPAHAEAPLSLSEAIQAVEQIRGAFTKNQAELDKLRTLFRPPEVGAEVLSQAIDRCYVAAWNLYHLAKLTPKYWKRLSPSEAVLALRHFLAKPRAELQRTIGAVEALTQPSGFAAELEPQLRAEAMEVFKPFWPAFFPLESLMTPFSRGRATATTLGVLVEESAHLLAWTFALAVAVCSLPPTRMPESIRQNVKMRVRQRLRGWPSDRPQGALLRALRIRELLRRELGDIADGDLERVRIELKLEREAATEPGAGKAGGAAPALRLEVKGEAVLLDGQPVRLDLTPEAAEEARRYLTALIEHAPAWVSGPEIESGIRGDRVRKRLPVALQALIKTDRRKGNCLAAAAWRK